MEKEKLIDAINSKGFRNSLITIYYNIGRALPFRAQRFPDGRVSDWYRNQFVEVHKVMPHGKGGKYGDALGFYFRNGVRENPYDVTERCWVLKDSTEPGPIPCAACGSWFLLDILGEAKAEPTKVYGLEDILDFGKHKGKSLAEVIKIDYIWVEWAIDNSDHFFCDIDAVEEERMKYIKVLQPEDIISFGKYQGKTVRYVFENDRDYLFWLDRNSKDILIAFDKLSVAFR